MYFLNTCLRVCGGLCVCVRARAHVCVVLYVLSLLCASNPQVPGAPGEQLKQGSGGLSAQGSRCSSLFHCSPYGPAVPGLWGPVSAAPPRPVPCHQAPLPSCLTSAITLRPLYPDSLCGAPPSNPLDCLDPVLM